MEFEEISEYLWELFEMADDWKYEYCGKRLNRNKIIEILGYIKSLKEEVK